VFESLVGFWYYQAACLIGGSEVCDERVFVFYIVVLRPILCKPVCCGVLNRQTIWPACQACTCGISSNFYTITRRGRAKG